MASVAIALFHSLKNFGIKYVKELFEGRTRWRNVSGLKKHLANDPTLLESPIDRFCEDSDAGACSINKNKKNDAFNDAFEEFVFNECLSNFKTSRDKSQALVESFMTKSKAATKRIELSSGNIVKSSKRSHQPYIDADEWRSTNKTVFVSENESDLEEMSVEQLKQILGIDSDDSPWELNHAERMVVLKKLPEAIRVPLALFDKLYLHQRVGLGWMAGLRLEGRGGILGDEMGLGKTMQALTFLFCLMSTKTIKNAMIICPVPIVKATWKNEAQKLLKYFDKTSPKINVCVVSAGSMPCPKQRNRVLRLAKNCKPDNPHLVITTYSMFTSKEVPKGFRPFNKSFEYIILDEGHKVKNKLSNTSININKIISNNTHVMVLSGTPLLNRLEELYRLLRLCIGDELLGKEKDFKYRYIKPIEAARQRTANDYELRNGEKVLQDLKLLINPYILKRKRKDHLANIVPENFQFDVWLKLSPKQRHLYQAYLTSDNKNVQGLSSGDVKCVLPVIGDLRMICGHPLLHKTRSSVVKVPQLQEEADTGTDTKPKEKSVPDQCASLGVDNLVSMSPKLEFLKDTTEKWAEEGHRTLIFAHHLTTLDIFEFVFDNMEGIDACRIDGSTSPKKLAFLVKHFNSDESMFNVLLMSTKVGSEGLTLTGASKCVVFEPVWTQADSDQAVARICRPGQRYECESLFLIVAGTVEEKMVGKQVYKGCLDRTVLGEAAHGSITDSYSRWYNKNDLSRLFELAEEGCCETLDKLKESGGYDPDKELNKCSVDKKHKSVLGISPRSQLYKKRQADDRVGYEFNDTSTKKPRLSTRHVDRAPPADDFELAPLPGRVAAPIDETLYSKEDGVEDAKATYA